MYFEIAAIIAVIIFGVLTMYVVRTLVAVQNTLRRIDILTFDLDIKIKQLESTVKAISNMGDICEEKSAQLKQEHFERQKLRHQTSECSDDLAEWLLASIKLGSKFIRRK